MTSDTRTQTFNYQQFYRDMSDSERLQVSKDELDWIQGYRKPEHTAKVCVALGCGGQTTPAVMLTQVAILKALDVDVVATAGQAYCCGNVFHRTDQPEVGERMGRKSIERFASWGSTVNVQSCGSCYVRFSSYLDKVEAETGTAPFKIVHITQFLLDTLKQLGSDVPWRRKLDRRVLLHAEGAEMHPTKEEARQAIIETLGLIPGVEYAGLVDDPSLGSPCQRAGAGHTVTSKMADGPVKFQLDDITPDQYRQVQAELAEQLDAAGADAIVTPHFTCHREWCKFGSDRLPIMYYQTLVAEALGIDIPDRFQMLWRVGDPEQVLELTRPHWESWKVTEPEAREMVKKFFIPKYASAVEKCPCEGNCFETETDLLVPGVSSPVSSRPTR